MPLLPIFGHDRREHGHHQEHHECQGAIARHPLGHRIHNRFLAGARVHQDQVLRLANVGLEVIRDRRFLAVPQLLGQETQELRHGEVGQQAAFDLEEQTFAQLQHLQVERALPRVAGQRLLQVDNLGLDGADLIGHGQVLAALLNIIELDHDVALHFGAGVHDILQFRQLRLLFLQVQPQDEAILLDLSRQGLVLLNGLLELIADVVQGKDAFDVVGDDPGGLADLRLRVPDELDVQELGLELADLLGGARVRRLEPLGVRRRDLESDQLVERLVDPGLVQPNGVVRQPLLLETTDDLVEVFLAVEPPLQHIVLILGERALVDERRGVLARPYQQQQRYRHSRYDRYDRNQNPVLPEQMQVLQHRRPLRQGRPGSAAGFAGI